MITTQNQNNAAVDDKNIPRQAIVSNQTKN